MCGEGRHPVRRCPVDGVLEEAARLRRGGVGARHVGWPRGGGARRGWPYGFTAAAYRSPF